MEKFKFSISYDTKKESILEFKTMTLNELKKYIKKLEKKGYSWIYWDYKEKY